MFVFVTFVGTPVCFCYICEYTCLFLAVTFVGTYLFVFVTLKICTIHFYIENLYDSLSLIRYLSGLFYTYRKC